MIKHPQNMLLLFGHWAEIMRAGGLWRDCGCQEKVQWRRISGQNFIVLTGRISVPVRSRRRPAVGRYLRLEISTQTEFSFREGWGGVWYRFNNLGGFLSVLSAADAVHVHLFGWEGLRETNLGEKHLGQTEKGSWVVLLSLAGEGGVLAKALVGEERQGKGTRRGGKGSEPGR